MVTLLQRGRGFELPLGVLALFAILFASCSQRNTSLDGVSMEELLEKELSAFDSAAGELVSAELPEGTRFVLFYASASWCEPCQSYTPALREWYEKTQRAGSGFEIVLVSGDSSQESLEAYVQKTSMPWKVFSYTASESDTMMDFKQGYPSSYLLDLKTGELLDRDAGAKGVGGRSLHSTVKTLEEQLAKLPLSLLSD